MITRLTTLKVCSQVIGRVNGDTPCRGFPTWSIYI